MRLTFLHLFILLSLLGNALAKDSNAQVVLNKKITINEPSIPLGALLEKLGSDYGINFILNSQVIDENQRVKAFSHKQPVSELLNQVLGTLNLTYEASDDVIVILNKPSLKATDELTSDNSVITVTGKVVDENGLPLPGVTIRLNNTNRGATTDANGAFTISVDADTDVLTFSYIGYDNKTVIVGADRTLNVQLQVSKANSLQEVVVVGYGTNTRANITTSVATVKGSAVNERPTTLNVVQGLSGKVSGVNVMTNSGRPGGNPTVKIRGTSSLNSAQNPLYVIDGFVGADPNTIDPSIVENVQVYKDAAASAIYGSRAANGVIVITTKKGNKNTSDIAFNNTVSFGSLAREIDLLDAKGALEMIRRQYDFVPGRLAPNVDPSLSFARKNDLFNADGSPKYNTNWQKEATRLAISNNNSLTFSGGKDNLTVLANITYRNSQGILLNSYQKQLLGNINIDWDVKPWLHIQATLNAGGIQGNNVEINTFGLNAVRELYEFLPFLPVKYPDGTYSRKGDFPGAEESENPVKLMTGIKDVTGKLNTRGNFLGTIHITKDLDFTSTFSGEIGSTYENYYSGTDMITISAQQGGIAQRTNGTFASWTNEDYFSYHKKIQKHDIKAVLGASWYDYLTSNNKAGSEGFFDDSFMDNSLQAGTVIETPTSSRDESRYNSFYTRLTYNYDDRYLVEGTLRSDGVSRFADEHKYGYFPSVSAAWRLSNESFFKPLKNTISDLKLRGSFGNVGNAEIGNYRILSTYANSNAIFNKVKTPSVTLATLGNPDLVWETVQQTDFGFDVAFFGGRIEFTADVYNKLSKDLLYNVQLPTTSGYTNVFENIGSIRNRGIELSLNTINIDRNGFKWNSGLNFTVNRSKVLELANGNIQYPFGGRIKEGEPVNEFFGYIREGVYTTANASASSPEGSRPGDTKYADLNDNGIKDAGDRTNLGNAMPKWEANFSNTISYKGFTFYLDLQGMYGNHLLNLPRFIMEGSAPNVNSFNTILQSGSQLPKLRLTTDAFSNNEVGDSHYIEDGSFLRVRNVAFSYRLSTNLLKKLRMKNVTVGMNIENALLFTKYRGYDPEATSFDGALNQGVDVYQYPKPRTVSFTLSTNF
ncbi:MAG: TonB-dependent receptor [Mucilaginibacter sp.]